MMVELHGVGNRIEGEEMVIGVLNGCELGSSGFWCMVEVNV